MNRPDQGTTTGVASASAQHPLDGPEVLLQIGMVAERTELSIRTLRHYDEVGLVAPSARSIGGFRLYTDRDVDRLNTIRRMKPLGFTLEEMRRLLESFDTLADDSASPAAKNSASAFLTECHARAELSCETLRRQLGYVEEFRTLLATNVGQDRDMTAQVIGG